MTKPHTRDLSIATQLGRVIFIMSDGKQVWHYHLTPFPTAEAVAAKAVAA